MLTHFSNPDGLQVSCHHVHRSQQSLGSFSNSQLTSDELLLEEPQSSMSTNGRNGIQNPVPGKEKYYYSVIMCIKFVYIALFQMLFTITCNRV